MAIVAVVVAVVVHSSPEAVVKPPFSHIDNISGLTQIVVGVKFRESADSGNPGSDWGLLREVRIFPREVVETFIVRD